MPIFPASIPLFITASKTYRKLVEEISNGVKEINELVAQDPVFRRLEKEQGIVVRVGLARVGGAGGVTHYNKTTVVVVERKEVEVDVGVEVCGAEVVVGV